jgi:hypothetical protein
MDTGQMHSPFLHALVITYLDVCCMYRHVYLCESLPYSYIYFYMRCANDPSVRARTRELRLVGAWRVLLGRRRDEIYRMLSWRLKKMHGDQHFQRGIIINVHVAMAFLVSAAPGIL